MSPPKTMSVRVTALASQGRTPKMTRSFFSGRVSLTPGFPSPSVSNSKRHSLWGKMIFFGAPTVLGYPAGISFRSATGS